MKIFRLTLLLILFGFTTVNAQLPVVNANGSVTVKRTDATFTLIPYSKNIVKVVVQPNGYATNEMISDAVVAQPLKTPVTVRPTVDSNFVVSWGNIQLVGKNDTIYFGDKKNAFLAYTFKSGNYNSFRFLLAPGEKIFGGGERALPLNRRGYQFDLYNQPSYGYGTGAANLNYSVPFITSSNNYALFFDNPSKGYLDIGKSNANFLEYGAFSGELNFYLIFGNSYADILSSYHSLTGTQPLPPRWALGNFLSRFGYTSEAEIRSIMQKMKAAKIPYDAVIIDLFWFGDSVKGSMGNLEWVNKKAWPNPVKMIGDFKKEGTKTVLITEPYVVTSSLNYTTSKPYHAVDSTGKPYVIGSFYFGPAGLIDIFRKDSKDWFWSKYKVQMNKGVEGWWGDLGEPENHPSGVYHNLKDLGYNRLFTADEVHNIYGHYWTKMLFEKFEQEYPDKRLFSLNRSGYAGTQRYSIFPWTGDVGRSWSGLQAQLPVLLGMSMSGVPYVHSDAGGFAGGERDAELYVRWLQFAQYTPLLKPHGAELGLIEPSASDFPSEPALFDEPYRSLAKKVMEERYALLPYNYTLAYQQATAGKPLISPLYYNFPEDTNSYKAEDELMWGESMLVAPVLQKGAATRRLYLPGGKWYHYKSLTPWEGGQWITDTVTMESIPVYVKAGSFIATNNTPVRNTTVYNTGKLTVTYFPSADTSAYTLFDDDGSTGKSLEKKQYELIQFTSGGWNNQATFTINSNKGNFNGKPSLRRMALAIPGLEKMPASIRLNAKLLARKKSSSASYVEWNKQRKTCMVYFTFTGNPVVIKVRQ